MPQGLLHSSVDSIYAKRKSTSTLSRFLSRPKRAFAFILVLCVVIYILLYLFILPSNVIIDEHYGLVADAENRIDYRMTKIAEECSTVTNICYVVMDKKVEFDVGEIVERHMYVKGFEEDSDTVVKLVSQNGKTFDNSDTRMWKVDHLAIQAQYIAALICAPFIVSTLSLVEQDNDNKKILEIGLGGGSLDMFIHELMPKIDITAVEIDPVVLDLSAKWFQVKDDNTRRTVVADGLSFIKTSEKSGRKFDVIVLDACDSSKTIPCPSEIFRKREILDSASRILKENGVFVVNILSYNDEDGVESNKIIKLLTETFQSCIQVTLKEEVNIIAICTTQSISDTGSSVDFLKRRATAVTMRLGLQEILSSIKFA